MKKKRLIIIILATTLGMISFETKALVNNKIQIPEVDFIKSNSTLLDEIKCEQGYSICSKTGGHAFLDESLKISRLKREAEELEKLRLEQEILKQEQESIQKENQRIQSVRYYDYDLTYISNITYNEMYKVLSNKTSGSMAHLSQAFIDAEQIHGVNAFFLAGLSALEGDWARSERAIYQNNLTGMAVYSDSSSGTSYTSQYECIIDTARQIKQFYLDPSSIYYGGGVGSSNVEVYYCESKEWNEKIDRISYDLSNIYGEIYR